jgi:hypothetical protein
VIRPPISSTFQHLPAPTNHPICKAVLINQVLVDSVLRTNYLTIILTATPNPGLLGTSNYPIDSNGNIPDCSYSLPNRVFLNASEYIMNITSSSNISSIE